MTHSQALLPDACLIQVDNSCLFCSALKIRWLLALFPHVEELTLSHPVPASLVHKWAQSKLSWLPMAPVLSGR